MTKFVFQKQLFFFNLTEQNCIVSLSDEFHILTDL